MTDFRDIDDRSLAELLAVLSRDVFDVSDPRRVVEDLRVHQIELEIQNRELRLAQQALEESRDRYADLYDFAPVAYATLTRQGRITQMNLTAAQLLGVERGRTPDLVLSTRLAEGDGRKLLASLVRVLDQGVEESIAVTLGRPPKVERDLRLVIRRETPPAGEPPTACRVILVDVTEQLALTERLKEREVQLEYLAHHDVLTGLPNRLLFTDRLAQAILEAHREQRQVAVLSLDLDRFSVINESFGHPAGDQVLQQAAQRTRALVREGETVARLGGDEFAILLGSLEHGDRRAGLVANALAASFAQPFVVDNRPVYVTASIGISLYPADGDEAAVLARNAAAAMRRAKEKGRGTFRFYTEEMTARVLSQVALEAALRQGIVNQEFVLYYQPQHDLETGAIVGCEALIRWQHPLLGLIGPERFLPLAESSGLILPIGVWVVSVAAAQMKAWRALGLLANAAVWVNLSSCDLQSANLAETIADILKAVDLDPGALAVEITERCAMADPESAAETIRRLLGLGVEVGIDGLGTGYLALAAHDRPSVRELKIDQVFVAGLPEDATDRAIVRAIIALGSALGLRVVATGVETQAQADFLLGEGCRIGQGYLFSPPLSAAAFEGYLTAPASPGAGGKTPS